MVVVTTETGSKYLLDKDSMSWIRLPTERSQPLRKDHGTLLTWPETILGCRLILHDSEIRSGFDAHFVRSTLVVSIEETHE